VVLARREALDADIVIVNHHLLLADLALKEDGFGDLLGSADAIILDEAHQIPDLATQFFGARVSSRLLETLLGDLRTELSAPTAAAHPAQRVQAPTAALAEADEALLRLRGVAGAGAGRQSWAPGHSSLGNAVQGLEDALREVHTALSAAAEDSPLAQLAARAAEVAASLGRIGAVEELEGARTLESTPRGFTLSLMPFDISQRFRGLIEERGGAWIFTSATLCLGEEFGHFTGRLGIADSPTLRIDSPFDHERQSLLLLPQGLPDPSSPDYVAAVIDTAEPLIRGAGGGAFVLFTSHRALAQGAALLRARWKDEEPFRLFVQGEAPRERLLEEFRADGNGVLLGTASFWEGVDVRGHALALVVIDKLPFAAPEDPLLKARLEGIRRRGGNPFHEFQLPQAVVSLKQGFGRLIRDREDFGVVMLCDPRLRSRGYGNLFFASLPPAPIVTDSEEAASFLRRRLARAGLALPAALEA